MVLSLLEYILKKKRKLVLGKLNFLTKNLNGLASKLSFFFEEQRFLAHETSLSEKSCNLLKANEDAFVKI